MRLQTFLFYVVPLMVLPVVTGWFIYQKGGPELLYSHWPQRLGVWAIACGVSFLCYKLDCMITKHKHFTGGIRRRD